ncbi:glycosyltransferase family 2 protein [Roseateles sp.]|uniref:glycosyltransferase family 2 protein n=1 Tax=Roseateles sp. TaxID=1971397 RepID=UPI003BA60A9D
MKAHGFTVAIPLYNKRAYVLEAVQSAVQQEPDEVIVVDDGSTDGGAELVESLGLARVRLVRQQNAGVAAARNAALALATSTWVAFLDADDRYQPGHLAALRDLAERFPSAGMLATGYCRVWIDGRRESIALPGPARLLHDFYGQWSRLTFTCADSIAVNVAVSRRSGISFPLGETLGEDQDVWFRMAEAAPVAYVGETRVDYRMEVAGSATAQEPRPPTLLPCYLRLNERLQRGDVPSAMRAGARRLLGSHWLNTARAMRERGDLAQGWALWRSPQARGHKLYWLRTGLRWMAGLK